MDILRPMRISKRDVFTGRWNQRRNDMKRNKTRRKKKRRKDKTRKNERCGHKDGGKVEEPQ